MRRIFRLPGTKRRLDEDLEQELRFHLEGRIEDLMEHEGFSRATAECEATRRFGDYDEYRREIREIDNAILHRRNRMDLIEAVRRETRHALRSLARAPAFSLVTILTLALGLGAATTIFTLLERVVLRPLPYPNADRLIHIGTMWPKIKAGEEYGISRGQYFYFKKNSNSLADLLFFDADVLAIPGDGDHPAERVVEIDASASTFAILGIRPERGRLFTAADELSPDGDPRVALISHGYWQRRFGGDPDIVGKRLPIGGDKSIEIIGVLPATATVPEVKGDVWIRNHLDPADKPVNNHTHHAIGLLRPGVTVAAAAADLQRVQNTMAAAYPDVYSRGFINAVGFALHVSSLRDDVVGPTVVRALWLLFGAVAFVLLIAGANVANLFLVRIDARRGEVAVRTALGADRAHLALHYLTESMLVAAIAGVGAIALGAALLHVVLAIAPQSLPRLDEVGFGWQSVAFCLGAALTFGFVLGVLPLGSIDVDVAVLREGGRGLTSSRSRELVRRTLALSQVALAVLLLAGGGLMTKSFARLRAVKPGFDPGGVVTMTVSLPYTRYPNSTKIVAFWRELLPRIEAMPGVVHAGASGDLPLLDAGGCSYVVTDATGEGAERANCMPMTAVTPGYFEAMGIKVRGTLPTWSSVEAGAGPTIVTAAFAKRFWRTQNVINRTVRPFNPRNPAFTVVGVADDIRANGLQKQPIEEVYFAAIAPAGMPQWGPDRAMHLVVRAPTLNASAIVAAVRNVVADVDPQVPLSDIAPMEIVVAKSMGQTSFVMLLLVISAAISLTLSAVGIYGVISYVVGQRRGEIGIRIALGAQASEVARLIVGQSLALAGAGVIVGVAGALAGTRLLRTLLFEVSPTDPLVLGGAAAALFIVAAFASAGPVRRAAKIDPVEAMRTG